VRSSSDAAIATSRRRMQGACGSGVLGGRPAAAPTPRHGSGTAAAQVQQQQQRTLVPPCRTAPRAAAAPRPPARCSHAPPPRRAARRYLNSGSITQHRRSLLLLLCLSHPPIPSSLFPPHRRSSQALASPAVAQCLLLSVAQLPLSHRPSDIRGNARTASRLSLVPRSRASVRVPARSSSLAQRRSLSSTSLHPSSRFQPPRCRLSEPHSLRPSRNSSSDAQALAGARHLLRRSALAPRSGRSRAACAAALCANCTPALRLVLLLHVWYATALSPHATL
jgi:hypothetical protein